MARADAVHRHAQARLQTATGHRLAALVRTLPEPRSQAAMDSYNAAAPVVVAGAQYAAARLAIGYMSRVAPPIRSRPAPTIARAVASVLVSGESPVARSPILRLWRDLDAGVPAQDAVTAAGHYAGDLASGDVQAAQAGGLEEGASAAGDGKIRGWRKELAGTACDWCVLVGEDRVYSSADSVPTHDRDECGVAPVMRGEE